MLQCSVSLLPELLNKPDCRGRASHCAVPLRHPPVKHMAEPPRVANLGLGGPDHYGPWHPNFTTPALLGLPPSDRSVWITHPGLWKTVERRHDDAQHKARKGLRSPDWRKTLAQYIGVIVRVVLCFLRLRRGSGLSDQGGLLKELNLSSSVNFASLYRVESFLLENCPIVGVPSLQF